MAWVAELRAATRGVSVSWIAVLFSCAGALGEPEPPLEEASLQDAVLVDALGAPVIATLKTRHGRVTITSGDGQVRYSVLDGQGESGSLSLVELQSRYPQLFELLHQATAVWAGR